MDAAEDGLGTDPAAGEEANVDGDDLQCRRPLEALGVDGTIPDVGKSEDSGKSAALAGPHAIGKTVAQGNAALAADADDTGDFSGPAVAPAREVPGQEASSESDDDLVDSAQPLQGEVSAAAAARAVPVAAESGDGNEKVKPVAAAGLRESNDAFGAFGEHAPGADVNSRASGGTSAETAVSGPSPDLAGQAGIATASTAKVGYPLFLERFKHSSAQPVVDAARDFLKDFPTNLMRPQAARRVHDFVSAQAPRLRACEAFAGDREEAAAIHFAAEGLEKFVILKLYKVLFRHAASDAREDERVERSVSRSALGKLPLQEEAKKALGAAVAELQHVDQYRAPRDKAMCMLNAFRVVDSAVLPEMRVAGALESDQVLFRRALAAVIVQAAPQNFFSNLEFTAAFRHPERLTVDEGACLREFAFALALVISGGNVSKSAAAVTAVTAAALAGEGPTQAAEAGGFPWLSRSGVTLRFEHSDPDDLLLSEVDELLDEYHRMLHLVRELAGFAPE